jgi:hypothetical protein
VKTLLITTSVLLSLSSFAAWRTVTSVDAGETGELRGFGRCNVTHETQSDGAKSVKILRFVTATPENAETVAGKFLFDLSRGVDVTEKDGVFAAPGAAFAVVKRGATVEIVAASDAATIKAWAAEDGHAGRVTLPGTPFVTKAACPAWMKQFAWGTYGMGGLENFHDWMNRAGAKRGEELDPREDYAFLKEMGNMHFDAWLQLEGMDDSDGITACDGVYWKTKYAEDLGLSYAFRLYMPCNGFDWASRRFGKHMEQPAEWTNCSWLRENSSHQPHMSWYDDDVWSYIGLKTYEQMKKFKTPSVLGWMHPAGEVAHQPWYNLHGDYSPMAKADWIAWLKKHGVTLARASEMYSRADDPFVAWEQVEPPEFATFAGLPKLVLDLGGTWLSSSNRVDWTSVEMPGSVSWFDYYRGIPGNLREQAARYVKRSFDWDPSVAKGRRVYLYFFPMSKENTRHALTLNGAKLADVGTWCALDVTDALRTGANELEMLLHGEIWHGRIFLSTQAPAVYPNLGEARNEMYALWGDWLRDGKARQLERVLDAMRQADPDAPIKMMAPIKLGQPITDRLCSDWGMYAHFTGEGVWYFPWYKRYAKLWGYQGTSELAGPYRDLTAARRSTLRVFLAGLDMHEPVFLTQTYSRNAPVREWWLRHKEMFARQGTYDIFGPQILLYRRSLATEDGFPSPVPRVGGEACRRVQTPWNWDIGRGTLQSIGQSMLYIDDDGIDAGKMQGHKVMVDCGNEVLAPERVARIADWVKDGGVFVALPFTGRSTATRGDAWPIAALAGAKAAKERPLGGTVTWKGRAFADRGSCRQCNGVELNETSVELAPEAEGVEVLATYENGAAAVTRRRLGKGQVIWLGSAFWRDAEDVMGIWWPGKGESAFWRELLADVGAEPAVCTTDDPLVWPQPYRSNDGLDAVTVLCNFNTSGVQRTTVTLRVPRKPRAITTWSERGRESVADFAYDAKTGTCSFQVDVSAQEVLIANARVFEPSDALAYWWTQNRACWHALKKPTLDLAPYREGEWKDPTQDLKTGWTFADTGKECVADVLQFWGLKDGAAATITKTFDVADADWFKGGEIFLCCRAWVGPTSLTPMTMTLNGVTLAKGLKGGDKFSEDVAKLLKPAGNVLTLAFAAPKDGKKFTGLCGAIYLYHRAPAARSLPLAKLPTTLVVPKEWEGRYRVFLHIQAKDGANVRPPLGAMTPQGRFMRRHHHNFGKVTDVDITSLLKFGEENVLLPFENDPTRPAKWDWSKFETRLDLFEM